VAGDPTDDPTRDLAATDDLDPGRLRQLQANALIAAHDLFDQPPRLAGRADQEAEQEQRPSLGLQRLILYPVVVTGLGLLFKFPATALFLLPFIGIALAVVSRSAHARPIALVASSSAFATQATSIFITPFTWPARFAFFVALFGGFGALAHSQLKHL
jgi:hypothetical protein